MEIKRTCMEHKVSYIPIDLLIEIFSRVPAKSIARFRCLSKYWRSILRRQDFTDLFLTTSSTRPRFLFILEVHNELFVFSSPQPQNTHENCFLVATRYNKPKHVLCFLYTKSDMVCGLIFRQRSDRKVLMICNHTTGELLTVPNPKTKTLDIEQNHFSYDPIDKQFKVLYMTSSNTHQVLTLETGKHLWRSIRCNFSCGRPYGLHGQICINGVLYFGAKIHSHGVVSYTIVCFEVRSEKFSFINIDINMSKYIYFLTLTNYKGKLGAYGKLNKNGSKEYVFLLWVLEDAGNHKWSEYTYKCPPFPLHKVDEDNLRVVGMTMTGEMVHAPYWLTDPFYVFFYNLETKTFTRAEIQGFEEFKDRGIRIRTFQDYVENIKLYK